MHVPLLKLRGSIEGTNELFVHFPHPLRLQCYPLPTRVLLGAGFHVSQSSPSSCSRTNISIRPRLTIDTAILTFQIPSRGPQFLSMEPRLTPTEVAVHRLRLPISPQRRMSCPPNGGIITAAVRCPTGTVASTPVCSPGYTLLHQTLQCEPILVRTTLNSLP